MKQKLQIVLLLAMAVAGIRLAWVFYERHQSAVQREKPQAPPLNPDYYVTPKKFYIDDLKSARDLTKQPVWVKVGYVYPYYSYDPASRRAALAHEAGKLLPIQKLAISDVITQASASKPGERLVLAVFKEDGKAFAAPVGTEKSGHYWFYVNDMLYSQDPHELYRHWPPEIWQAIDQHQVKLGMSELQVNFAIGIGLLESGGDSTDRTLDYPNGGMPLIVSYHSGKAIGIH